MALSELAGKIVTGSLWTVLMRWSSRLLGIISVIILARILLPEDYGLVAKAVLFSSLLELMTQFGFNTALIRNKHATSEQYNTVWTLNILRGLILALAVWGGAGYVADFFSDSRIYPLILVYGVTIFISGLTNVGVVDFHKNMQFDKDFKLIILSRLTSFTVTLAIAVIYRSYWAFPLGTLAGVLVSLFASYLMSPFRPVLSLSAFNSIFNFSKWFFLYESFSALATKFDTFLLSKWGSTEELGLYTVSSEIAGMPSTEIAMPVARASLPALAQHADNLAEFRPLYTQVLISVLFIAIPASVGLSVLADYIVVVVLGSVWAGAAIYIKILAFIGISRVNVACAVSALAAAGRADVLGRYSMLMLTVKCVAMSAGMYWFGAEGLAWGALAASLSGMLLIHKLQSQLQLIAFASLFNGLWRVLVAATVMWLSLYYLSELQVIKQLGVTLLVTLTLVFTGVVLYGTVLIMLWLLLGRPDGPERKVVEMITSRFASA
ncbi:lipopolysaccharide biosynthesis protein [Arsukibacterium perlucidum]|uniref:lipopolysaccharide biosynthesis protein n=1 Tax=Arsukibacterium perlucidum TaxID=368811 RepID=UPI0003660BA6|nr:lipopolysaccharide biosynthesis protein [Arsukibacterium perlucidum]